MSDAILRVVELGDHPTAGMCGRLLQAAGGQVTKLSTRTGPALDPMLPGSPALSAVDAYLEEGKHVLSVAGSADLGEHPAILGADVLVTALRDDELAALSLDPAALRRSRPDLILARTSTTGWTGRFAQLRATEFQALALSGLLSMVGDAGREPLRLGGRQGEYAAGLALFSAIMLALESRTPAAVDGAGAEIRTSSLQSLAYLDWKSHIYYSDSERILQRGSVAGPFVLRCADGHVGFYYREEEWRAVKALVGDPELEDPAFATQPDRDRNRTRFLEIMARFGATAAKHDVYHRAQALGIPVGTVATASELLHDPQYLARRFVNRFTEPSGRVLAGVTVPWTVDGSRPDASARPSGSTPTRTPGATAALEGMRILDLSGITAGGRTTQLLGDFGAEVVKVEWIDRPDPFRHWTSVIGSAGSGDLGSPPFRVVGRSKRAVAIDLKTPRGRDLLRELVRRSDVVVENFARGVMERLGLDMDVLREWNPRVALLSLSSQGGTGPERGYKSFGGTLEALGGLMSMTGYDADSPTWSTSKVNYPDQAVSLIGPGLVLLAARESRRTGRGVAIDLSQRELVTAMLGEWLVQASATGESPEPQGNRGPDAIDLCCRCAGEDEWVTISVEDASGLAALRRLTGHEPEDPDAWAAQRADARFRDELARETQEWTSRLGKWAATDALQAMGIASAPVLRAWEVVDRAGADHAPFHVDVPARKGTEEQFGWPFEIAGRPAPSPASGPPRIGEHTVEIAGELGYGPDEIEELLRSRVAYDPGRTSQSTEESR